MWKNVLRIRPEMQWCNKTIQYILYTLISGQINLVALYSRWKVHCRNGSPMIFMSYDHAFYDLWLDITTSLLKLVIFFFLFYFIFWGWKPFIYIRSSPCTGQRRDAARCEKIMFWHVLARTFFYFILFTIQRRNK